MTDQTTANPDILGSLINAMKSIDPNAIAVLQQMFPNDPAVNAAISLLPAFAPIIQYIESGVSSTGGAWSAHLAGLWLKKYTGAQWIVEVHDPLVIRSSPNAQGFQNPKNRDAKFRHYLEKQITQYADQVWWFTDGALHYATVRNPNLNTPNNAHGFMVLPGAKPPGGLRSAESHVYSEKLNLCHFGSLAKDRSLSTILNALVPLFRKYPESRELVRVHAYGAPLDSLTTEAIKNFGFSDVLFAHGRLEKDLETGKSGRERVVEKMQSADVLILLHGRDEWCAEYIPSKFYEYLWTGRPIWGITHRNPQLDDMLRERDAYLSQEGDVQGIADELEKIWLDWRERKLAEPKWLPIGVDQAVHKILAEITWKPEEIN